MLSERKTLTPLNFSFDGNTIYYGDIYLYGCRGVKFNGGTIAVTNIYCRGAVNNYFNNVDFQDLDYPTTVLNIIPNFTTPSKVVFTDCTWPSRVAIDSDWRLNGGLLHASRSTDVTIASGASQVVQLNTIVKNAISANGSYTVDNFYDNASYSFDFTKVISPKRTTLGSALINLTFGNLTTYNDATVEVYLYDVTNSLRLGVFTKGIELSASGYKYRIYTYSGSIPTVGKIQIRVDNGTGGAITLFGTTGTTPSTAKVQGF